MPELFLRRPREGGRRDLGGAKQRDAAGRMRERVEDGVGGALEEQPDSGERLHMEE